MKLGEIVEFWSQQRQNERGRWTRPADDPFFESATHWFNLDFPVSRYVGDIVTAPIIILGANAGYDPHLTPTELPDRETTERYVARVAAPSTTDWSFVSEYYDGVNYGQMLADGRAALKYLSLQEPQDQCRSGQSSTPSEVTLDEIQPSMAARGRRSDGSREDPTDRCQATGALEPPSIAEGGGMGGLRSCTDFATDHEWVFDGGASGFALTFIGFRAFLGARIPDISASIFGFRWNPRNQSKVGPHVCRRIVLQF